MNTFDELYDIRNAEYDDIEDIMEFIGTWWRKDHILAVDRSFFEYEHFIDNKVTFIVAKDRKKNEIAGVLGYLYASRALEFLDIWTGLWRVRTGERAFLGMEMYKRIQHLTGARNVLGIGDTPQTTGRLLRGLTDNFVTFKMDHFYILNPRIHDYVIADVRQVASENIIVDLIGDMRIKLCEGICDALEQISVQKDVPYKDAWYIKHRFFDHPIYDYDVYALNSGDGSAAILVMRVQEYSGACCLRIVDYIGEQSLFGRLGAFFQEIIENRGFEYIDIYTYGMKTKYLESAGFTRLNESDDNIIPDYFNPYERVNVDIWASGTTDKAVFFKADGDQDRPN